MAENDFVNAEYLKVLTLSRAQIVFLQNQPHSIQLTNILNAQKYALFLADAKKLKWKQDAVYDIYSYCRAQLPPIIGLFLSSKEFLFLVSSITNKKVKKITAEITSIGHRDYTLLNDKKKEEKGIMFELELTSSWSSEWGGYTSFCGNEEEVLRISPKSNSLTLVQQDQNTQSFIKYVNHNAKNNKRIVVRGFLE